MKRCKRCKEEKALEDFAKSKNSHNRSGFSLSPYCRPCNGKRARAWNDAHPEKFAATKRRYELRRQYGLTQEEFESILVRQRGLCAICLKPFEPGTKNFHVDHDHKAGIIRGILCPACNLGLGHFQDNPDILKRAAWYIYNSNTASEQ